MHHKKIFHSLQKKKKKQKSKIQITNLHYIMKHLLKHFVTSLKQTNQQKKTTIVPLDHSNQLNFVSTNTRHTTLSISV